MEDSFSESNRKAGILRNRKNRDPEDIYGVSFEVAKSLGLSIARANNLYMKGKGYSAGISSDDYRCDADAGQKLIDAMRIFGLSE